jgi:hypothetical protein
MLGKPKGDMYEWKFGCLMRDFEKGKVIVNFSRYTYEMNLGRNFKTLDGNIVSQIRIPDYSGAILFEEG